MNIFEGTRNDFLNLLKTNPGIMIFKFGAEWCKPCQEIKGLIDTLTLNLPENIVFYDVDVDESFDLYAFMKTKKMVRGIPTILRYNAGNDSYISDDSISGTNEKEITTFFTGCKI